MFQEVTLSIVGMSNFDLSVKLSEKLSASAFITLSIYLH